ncbi:gliding motility-associated C-terminal domain-containing protein [Pontibacter ruber]|uniref:Gliding motility-associated C-terminal domain-containing protein n=1 Tax=Pontibacter ruber TaxID=1343895 RepID=A0ABW5CWR5_9BACT|nr:gliding motility-associated C-terminal domain-containing protein [Pontibacter ruber]
MQLIKKSMFLPVLVLFYLLCPGKLLAQSCTPVISATGNASLCQNEQVVLMASPAASYKWSNGATSQSITVTKPGDYSVTTTTAEGCVGTSAPFTVAGTPDASIEDPNFFFTYCSYSGSAASFNLEVQNTSKTKATNKSYTINWGDGKISTYDKDFETASHTYTSAGSFKIIVTATGEDGCTGTSTEQVFIGSNPGLGITSDGNNTNCAPATFEFKITGVEGNSPLTVYTFQFDDGTPAITYKHSELPADRILRHTFTESSKDKPNGFTLRGTATNPCNNSIATFTGIRISKGPVADFAVSNKVCIGVPIKIQDQTKSGYDASSRTDKYKVQWEIQPATGWTYIASNSTTPSPTVRFDVPGEYKLILTATPLDQNSTCMPSTKERTIIVNDIPKADFSLSFNGTCAPASFAATNKSTGQDLQYLWQVDATDGWAFAPGSQASSANPVFNFTKAGKYKVSLITSNNCSITSTKDTTLVIADQPIVKLPEPNTYCGPQTISFSEANKDHQPVYDAQSGEITGYRWSVKGPAEAVFASGTSSTSAHPSIEFTTPGTYEVSVVAINSCGESEPATQVVTIDPVPVVNAGDDRIVCLNSGTFKLEGLPAGGTWSGSAHVQADGTFNPAAAGTFTLTYTYKAGTCEISDQMAVTVNTLPEPPKAEPVTIMCPGSSAILRVLSPKGEIAWYDAPTGGNLLFTGAEFPTPALEKTTTFYVQTSIAGGCTSTRTAVTVDVYPATPAPVVAPVILCGTGNKATLVAEGNAGKYEWYEDAAATRLLAIGKAFTTEILPEGKTTYYVRGVTNGCYSPLIAAEVTILSALDKNTLTGVPTICNGQAPATITGSTPQGGDGKYTYYWEASITSPTTGFEKITGATGKDYKPSTLTRTTWYRRVVVSASCSHTSAAVEVTVTPALTNNTITATAPVCVGGTAGELIGSMPIGGNKVYEYTWESSTTGANGSFTTAAGNNTAQNYSPGTLSTTTWFRRKVTSGPCAEIVSAVVEVKTIKPITNNTISSSQTICKGSSPAVLVGSPPEGGTDSNVYRWEMRTQGGAYEPARGTNNGLNYTPQINDKTMWYRRVVTGGPCGESISNEVQITVQPAIENNTIEIAGQQIICKGMAKATLTGATPEGGSGSYTYRWLYSTAGPNATFEPAPGANTAASYTSPAVLTNTTWYRREVVSGECISYSAVVEVTVVDLPATPVVAPVTVCEGSPATHTVNSNSTNTFRWYASATADTHLYEGYSFKTPALHATTTYYVEAVNVNGCGSSERKAVVVTVNKNISSNSITTVTAPVCAGQQPALITGSQPENGSGTYTYRWESSEKGPETGFSPVAGATGISYQPGALDKPTWFRRAVTSGPCAESISAAVKVEVLPAISNNTLILAKATICAGDVPNTITGAAPAGGSGQGSYTYLWESSTDGVNYTSAAGTNNQKDYTAPAALSTTTWYRRTVYSAPCAQSVSMAIKVVVQPAITNNTITTKEQTFCAGEQPAQLLAARPAGGNDQPVYLWESRTEGSGRDFEPAAGVNNGMNYQPGALTQTTWFRRKVTAGECFNMSEPVRVVVNPVIANNTISSDQTICTGNAPATITSSTPTGGDGTKYTFYWEAAGADGVFRKISNATSASLTPGVLTSTTQYRRVVTSGACSQVSNVVTITVSPAIANNSIGLKQSIYAGQTPAPLTGTLPTGGAGPNSYTYAWESSKTKDGNYQPAAGLNNGRNYSPQPLQEPMWFRRRVFSGGCEQVSEPVLIDVILGITNNNIYADQTICAGNKPAPLNGSVPKGGDGDNLYLWIASTKGPNTGFVTAPGNSSGQNYSPAALTQSTWFRRVVVSGPNPDTSAAVLITVKPPMANNKISTSQTICYGTAPTTLTGTLPTGGSGNYTYLWESSTAGPDKGFMTAAGASNQQHYSPGTLTQTTWFRRVVTSESCDRLVSEVVAVTITPLPASPIAKGITICSGTSTTLTATGKGGRLEWYTSATGGNPVKVGDSFTTPILISTTTYYVQEVSLSCASERKAVTVTVTAPSANAGEDVTIIRGRSTTLEASGGMSYSWSPAVGMSDANVANPLVKPEKTTTYTVTVTTETGCVFTDQVTVTVLEHVFVPNTFTPNRDGVNDTWEILNLESYPNCKVQVFNQWGNEVFSSQGYKAPWDGRQNGQELPLATYYYIIHLDKTEKPLTGSVTIVK